MRLNYIYFLIFEFSGIFYFLFASATPQNLKSNPRCADQSPEFISKPRTLDQSPEFWIRVHKCDSDVAQGLELWLSLRVWTCGPPRSGAVSCQFACKQWVRVDKILLLNPLTRGIGQYCPSKV